MADQPQTPNKLTIQASEDAQRGVFSNVARITHTPEEFVLDFVFISPDPPVGTLGARVILTPGHAKRFLAALQDNIARYERAVGEIKAGPALEIPGGEN